MEMDTSASDPQFMLSAIVEAHGSDDVKALQSTSKGVIISGGRDDCVRFWIKRGGEYTELVSYPQEKGKTVSSVGYYENDAGWRLFVGRKDGLMVVHGSDIEKESPVVHKLHEGNIACIHVDNEHGVVLTGSWDKTATAFRCDALDKDFKPLRLAGHTLSVLALATLPTSPDYFLTAGADRLIKLWHSDTEVKTFTGHTDVVRDLCVLSATRFLSAANDASIKLWDLDSGVCLASFSSLMDHFIYSIRPVGDRLVSVGEGGHVEVWKKSEKDGEVSLEHSQLIHTPSATLWNVCPMNNGDFVTGSSDGRLYFWTLNEKRKVSADIQETFDAAVAAQVAKRAEETEKQGGSKVVIKVALDDGAPSMELVYEKGTDPAIAAEKFIRDNNLPISYLNEIIEYIKANIPEARAASAAKMKPQETQRVVRDGKAYDFVFDITLDDGNVVPLCYNVGDDVDFTAQQFVEKYNLPMKFLAKISGFLRSEVPMMGGGVAQAEDPFTGSGRYVPGSQAGGASFGGDPFTSGSRYVPGQSQSASSNGGDPFTSEGRYVPGSTPAVYTPGPIDKKKPKGDLCPLQQFFSFGVEQVSAKAKAKLREHNAEQSAYQLNEQQVDSLERLMSCDPLTVSVDDILVSALDMGLQWHISHILPVVDVFRIALLNPKLNQHYCDVKCRGAETLQKISALLISDPPEPVRAVLCRCLTNAFLHEWGQEMMMLNMEATATLLSLQLQQMVSKNRALQRAATTTLANWSLILLRRSEQVSELGPREDLLRALIKVLEEELSFGGADPIALVRLLQALATLMWGDSSVISLAKSRKLNDVIGRLKDAVEEEPSKALCRDIIEMIYAV